MRPRKAICYHCGDERRIHGIKWIVVLGELLVVMREGRQPGVVRIEDVARGRESGQLVTMSTPPTGVAA